jgi:hypothetical protein
MEFPFQIVELPEQPQRPGDTESFFRLAPSGGATVARPEPPRPTAASVVAPTAAPVARPRPEPRPVIVPFTEAGTTRKTDSQAVRVRNLHPILVRGGGTPAETDGPVPTIRFRPRPLPPPKPESGLRRVTRFFGLG